jgi:hypothetical protein
MNPSTIERIIYLSFRERLSPLDIAFKVNLPQSEVTEILIQESIAIAEMKAKSEKWKKEDPDLSPQPRYRHGDRVELTQYGRETGNINNWNRKGTFIRYQYDQLCIHWDGTKQSQYVDPRRVRLASQVLLNKTA